MAAKPQFRKTKIIATVGPACDDVDTLTQMIQSGMNVARLNLSHGNFDEHHDRVERIREAAKAAGSRVAIMIDTRGIEIRTGLLRDSYVDLNRGAQFTLRTDGEPGDQDGVSVSYAKLPGEVSVGDIILLDDGAIELEALSTTDNEIVCRVVHGGILGKTKGVNLPDILYVKSSSRQQMMSITSRPRLSRVLKTLPACARSWPSWILTHQLLPRWKTRPAWIIWTRSSRRQTA